MKPAHNQIVLRGSCVVECTIRDLSLYGACLQVTGPFPIPDEFQMTGPARRNKTSCKVRWRRNGRLGMAFLLPSPIRPNTR